MLTDFSWSVQITMSILDQIEIIEETAEQSVYVEHGEMVLDSTGDRSLSIDDLSLEVVVDEKDTENPGPIPPQAFCIRRIYGSIDIREWII
jgi:hypothetical protein